MTIRRRPLQLPGRVDRLHGAIPGMVRDDANRRAAQLTSASARIGGGGPLDATQTSALSSTIEESLAGAESLVAVGANPILVNFGSSPQPLNSTVLRPDPPAGSSLIRVR